MRPQRESGWVEAGWVLREALERYRLLKKSVWGQVAEAPLRAQVSRTSVYALAPGRSAATYADVKR